MARLANSGQYIANVATSFPTLGNQVVKLVKDLSGAGTVDVNITKLVEGIARLASAGKKAGETAANMQKLGDSVINLLNRLKNAPAINANIANTIQGLGNLAASGSRISTVANNAGTSGIRLGNVFRTLKDRFTGANKSTKGLVSSIGMFYAKAFLLIRAVKKLGGAIGSAQNYIEEFNYFSVALDKIGKDSENQFKKAGYNSAEEYAKSFRTRFAKLQTQMTGYKVDYNTGDATSNMKHNLGLDLTEVMNFNAALSQISNSAGMLGETSIMTSKALSMLSADWSSLSNQELSDVMNNMQSALIGQSRAVYKYGIDITSAGLAQTAFNHGLDVSIKDLSQQSKMQLRVLTMLEQSKVAYGDLARTINQPANQLRMLQAGFKNLARSIGNLFLPVVQKLYPYLNAVVMVLNEFVQWVAKMAGINLGYISGISLPDYADATDGMDDYADATEKAAKKQKKLNDNLQGFDIINKLQKDDTNFADDDDKKNKNLDLSSDIASALANYEKIWNKAFKSNQNKAVQLAQKIKKALLDGWNKGGDFTELGEKLANWINKGLNSISWTKIKNTTNKIVKSVATFLNGFVNKLKWGELGENIAEGLNTAISAAYTWWTTFNWLKFGKSLSEMLNSSLNKLNAKLLGKTLGAKLRGVVQFAFGFVTNFDFEQLGTKIANAINGFLENMGNVDPRTGLTGWQEMGQTISKSIVGILETINTALSTVKWTEVGKAIGQFIGSIKWGQIFVKTGLLVINALWSSIKVAVSTLATDPLGIVSAITTIMAGWFTIKKLASVTLALKTAFSGVLQTALTNATNALKTGGIKGLLSTKLGKIGAIAITLTIAVEGIKWANEKWSEVFSEYSLQEIEDGLAESVKGNPIDNIISSIFGEESAEKVRKAATGFWAGLGAVFSGKYSTEEWSEGLKQLFTDIKNSIIKSFTGIVKWFSETFIKARNAAIKPFFTVGNFFIGVWGNIKNAFKTTKSWIGEVFSGAWNNVKSAWNGTKSFFSGIWSGIKGVFGNVTDWFKDKFSKAWETVKNVFSTGGKIFDGIKDGILNGLKTVINGLIGGINKVIKIPFEGINKALKAIKNVGIGGMKPFKNLIPTINIPQIPTFATGGFPDRGQLFLANEAGAELVGNMNGKTAVANQEEIAQGFATAITKTLAPVMYAAFKQAAIETAQQSGGDVYLDGKKITDNVVGHINTVSKSRGKSPLWGVT